MVQRVKYILDSLGAVSNNVVVLESFDQPTTVTNLQWQGFTSVYLNNAWTVNWGVYKSEKDPPVVYVTDPNPPYQANYFEPVEHLMAGGTIASQVSTNGGQRVTEWPGVVVNSSMQCKRGEDLVFNARVDSGGCYMSLVLTYTLVT